MRILLDENLPQQLKDLLPGYDVYSVTDMGWKGLQNGDLLKKLQESKREDRKDRRADEDILRKLKQLEEKNIELQKQLATQKAVDGQWSYRPFVGSNVITSYLNYLNFFNFK